MVAMTTNNFRKNLIIIFGYLSNDNYLNNNKYMVFIECFLFTFSVLKQLNKLK